MKVDPRFLKEEGSEIFLGNELLVKGLLETEGGTHLWTGYPGSPIAGFFDCIESIQELPKKYGIHASMANNEALSVAMVNGSQMAGLRAITAMKSVGVHVASDALALGNLAGAHPDGGAVVVLGDDPWSDSTQVPADSRFLCKHLMMPVLEPSTYQELKDWIDIAFKLSREAELYIGYLVTTNQADGGGTVTVKKNQFPVVNTNQKTTLDTKDGLRIEDMVLLPPRTWRKEQDMQGRVLRLWAAARQHGVNKIFNKRPARAEFGFIVSGMAFTYLEHALSELALSDKVPILKMGVTYPLDPTQIEEFAGCVKNIFVIEERRGFLEEQVAQIVMRFNQRASQEEQVRVYGKEFPHGLEGIPSTRGLNPSMLIERLAPLFLRGSDPAIQFDRDTIEAELNLIRFTGSYDIDIINRTPTFCPGCPHRDSASVLMDIKKDFMRPDFMKTEHKRDPVDLVFHGDTGCYTMLMFEPTKDLMHNYSGMGLGGGTGAGIDPFINNKQIVFMGDGTFFHSGQVAISNAIKNKQDITFIILDNKTTAMTGHQPTPSVDYDLLGRETFAQDIENIVNGMIDPGHTTVTRTNPAYRETYRQLLEDTILKDGVKVIIADKECGITYNRRINREERKTVREKGYLEKKKFINISPDVCEHCLECTKSTGCPGLSFLDTDYGRKVQTDLSWCVADTACLKLHVCPSFEEVIVERSVKPAHPLDAIDLTNLPEPQRLDFKHAWRAYLAGVGGMGIAVSTAALVRAGHKEGYTIQFCEKNGLAIRNGGIYSQVTYLKPGKNHSSPIIPYGKADLILGVDILEAVRGVDQRTNIRVGSPDYSSVVVNTEKTPTILTLLGKEDFDVKALEEKLIQYSKPANYFGVNVSALSEKYFGTKLYANILMLGVAYQNGVLPLSYSSLEWAIKETMGPAAADNVRAFNLGRKVVVDSSITGFHPVAKTYQDVVAEKSEILIKEGNKGRAAAYRKLVLQAVERLQVDGDGQRELAVRLYDLIQFQGAEYAQKYLDILSDLHVKDRAEFGFAATKAAIWNLHKVMCMKDEFYVAHLLTSEEKFKRDRLRYNVDEKRGDKLVYTHLNKPHYEFFGFEIEFNLKTKNWMLNILKNLKFVRPYLGYWHFGPEKAFRDWYIDITKAFSYNSAEAYRLYVEALQVPKEVTGYFKVSRPKMITAREKADALFKQIAAMPQADIGEGFAGQKKQTSKSPAKLNIES